MTTDTLNAPEAVTWGAPAASANTRVSNHFATLARKWANTWERAQARRSERLLIAELSSLDAHLLRDIGIEPAIAARIQAARPRDPRVEAMLGW